LTDFYSTQLSYYKEIDFTSDNWIDQTELGYQQILCQARKAVRICEIGCGNANILKHHPKLQSHYFGCDFSTELMERNMSAFPSARFTQITRANSIPFSDQAFDFVFSVFVLEHSTNPGLFLDECARVLAPGGRLTILCPDFLGAGRMTSQRAGFSEGTASKKLKQGKIIDAFVTLYDNRIRIPRVCRHYARKAVKTPLFLVNLSPVVFDDSFAPDVDAVYVTFRDEIQSYLGSRFEIEPNSSDLANYEQTRKILFLSFLKK
jgi:SAM-dependent methyltransferase